ncbi:MULTISPECIES: hypothetical protein [Mycolicibacterium]|uniref:Uncharacterized protein n=2 Tax=Mycolicibacterium TaxID=1866885 RepID=A0A6N4USU5_9MYCO|nr:MULTISPECIES: hypothetical protein [Mycolicibacterium]MBP2453560.1 hypothetical protein [Mycolicibacterium lutetiense]MCV7001288.1 hypothetical protein [Mycolicibacterium alvei]BBX26737.1 hypothetical protein MALV_18620 [Mycolicibacterium alvei]
MSARGLLLLPGGFALLAGLNAALPLLGLPAPVRADGVAEVHGILLTLGFVGTVVALERAVAAGRTLGYLAPAALGAGAVLLVLPVGQQIANTALLIGTAALVVLYVPLWRRNTDIAVLIQAGGAVLAVGAALLWSAHLAVPVLLPWLSGFLILTIAGERLELTRIVNSDFRTEAMLAGIAGAYLTAALAALLWPGLGYRLLGLTLLAMIGWLAWHDVARRTVRGTGLPRYMAVCLLTGYAWLLVPAGAWVLIGQVPDGRGYDAVVHAVMLGFVMSMIMAHAPVILPAVLRRPLPYTPMMYGPVVLLHVSLLLRIAVGDAGDSQAAVQWGGVLNIVAVLAFVVVAVVSVSRRTIREAEKVAA